MRLPALSSEARLALVSARDEAHCLDHAQIDSEHILLGLLHVEESVPPAVLRTLGVDVAELRQKLRCGLTRGIPGTGYSVDGDLPLTDRARTLILTAKHDTVSSHRAFADSQALILGLLADHDGLAARLLREQGLTDERVRELVVE